VVKTRGLSQAGRKYAPNRRENNLENDIPYGEKGSLCGIKIENCYFSITRGNIHQKGKT